MHDRVTCHISFYWCKYKNIWNINFSQSPCIFSITEADEAKCDNIFQDVKKSESFLASNDQTEGEKWLHISRSLCVLGIYQWQKLWDTVYVFRKAFSLIVTDICTESEHYQCLKNIHVFYMWLTYDPVLFYGMSFTFTYFYLNKCLLKTPKMVTAVCIFLVFE